MSSDNRNGAVESLQRIMASERTTDFRPMGRAEFEARFVEPHRRRSPLFANFGRWVFAAAAMTVVTVSVFVVPKMREQKIPSSTELIASGELKNFNVANFGEVIARNARLIVTTADPAMVRAQLNEGECLIRFGKNVAVGRKLRVGDAEFTVTGTIVFASATAKAVAVIEGQITDAEQKVIAQGVERNIVRSQDSPISAHTYAEAMKLSDVSAYQPKSLPIATKEPSLEEQIFRKYGNVYSVSLNSQVVIFAAKIKDAESGQEKLFTLKGPLYISEADIREVKRIR